MLAIETKFLGPTDHKGARIKAMVCEGTTAEHPRRTITISYDYIGHEEAHHKAIRALIDKLGWVSKNGYGNWIVGATELGYVAVCNAGDYCQLKPAK